MKASIACLILFRYTFIEAIQRKPFSLISELDRCLI